MTTTLAKYYRAIDEGRIEEALGMLRDKVFFLMVLPAGRRRGQGRDEMGSYLSGRGVPDRMHVVLRESLGGDVEFVYGKVTEGSTTTGHFLAAARIDSSGLIASYQVTFDPEHVLMED